MRKLMTLALFPVFCGAALAEGLVSRTDYDVPEAWAVKKVLGRDMYWIVARGSPWTKKWDFPDLAMTEHLWYKMFGWFGVNDLVTGINLKKPKYKRANWAPADPAEWDRYSVWTNYPAKFTDLLEATMGGEKGVQGFLKRYPGHPIKGWCPDLRPLRWLKPDFDTDRENFKAWKAAHPTFLGFQAFCEFEGEWSEHSDKVAKESGPEIYARIAKYFPYSPDKRVQADYSRKVCKHVSNFYFGETNLMAIASICPASLFCAARTGHLRYMQYEAELGSTSGPYVLGGINVRGCSRQYDIPFGWYLATYMHFCYTRDGKNQPGDLQWAHGKTGSWTSKFRPYRGAPRSLLNRAAFYGLMIGASSLEMEKWPSFFLETETPDSPIRPSRYMLDFNRVFEINKQIDRGAPYNPVAVLTSLEETFSRSNYVPEYKDKWSQLAFFNTLVPLHVDDFACRFAGSNRKKGDVGCMWNSEFGEIVDALCPDADQPSDDFTKALSNYKAAFLVGWFNKDRFDRAALEKYVKGGGTLFVDSEKLAGGYIGADMTGVTFSDGRTAAADDVFRKSGSARSQAFRFTEPYAYRKGTPTTAKPYLVDAKGGVIAWVNDFGKGRVVTVSIDRMLPEAFVKVRDWQAESFSVVSCRRTFPLLRYLLREVQRETMPVTVEGDIQWGVNKTAKGWLVWLINNKGVTKFSGEPEEIDPKAASTVRVTDKATGRVYEKTVEAGGYGWIEIGEENAKKPVFLNFDDTHFYNSRYSWTELGEKEVRDMVRQFRGSDVTDFLFCIGGRIADVSNGVKMCWLDKYDQRRENGRDVCYTNDRVIATAKRLQRDAGIDPFALWVDEAHRSGIKAWLSFRMNDCHATGMETAYLHSDFYHAHPEYRRGRHREKRSYYDSCYDYGIKAVRDREIAYISEVLNRYDADGVEIDWLREPYCFVPGHEDAGLMTRFMRRVRAVADAAAKRRGRPVRVAVRVPANPLTALEMGFDVAAWAQEGIVDVVSPCPRWRTTDSALPVGLWKRLLRGTDAAIVPGVELLIANRQVMTFLYQTKEQLYGNLNALYSNGADGVYFYNFFDDPRYATGGYFNTGLQPFEGMAVYYPTFLSILREAGSPSKVAAADRDHVLTYEDLVPLWKRSNPPFPDNLTAEDIRFYRIVTGEVPASAEVTVRVGVKGRESASPLVYVNGKPCSFLRREECVPAFTKEPLHVYSVPSVNGKAAVVEVLSRDKEMTLTHLDLIVR